MKKILLGISIFILICCSNTKLKYCDVYKYDWLRPFLIDSVNFSGKHNIDRATLDFSFRTDKQAPFIYLDSIASFQEWSLGKKTINSRTYIRNIKVYEADNKVDTLEITHFKEQKKLNYKFY